LLDFGYILLTIAFFAIMLAYVSGCAGLGRDRDGDHHHDR
jgi:hypothetical protein